MDAAAELGLILTEAATLGLADAATYTPTGGSPLAVTVSCQDDPQADLGDFGGRIRRRQLIVLLLDSVVAAPAVDDALVIAAGAYAGSYVVTHVGMRDTAGRMVTVRQDAVAKAQVGSVERYADA